MSADDYLAGRAAFGGKDVCNGSPVSKVKRDPKKAKKSRAKETKRIKEIERDKLSELKENKDKSFDEIENMALIEAEKLMDNLAALHNPDMIAGGADVLTGSFGDRGVNSSIGASWKSRVSAIDIDACKARKEGKGKHKMDVDLHRCGKGKK